MGHFYVFIVDENWLTFEDSGLKPLVVPESIRLPLFDSADLRMSSSIRGVGDFELRFSRVVFKAFSSYLYFDSCRFLDKLSIFVVADGEVEVLVVLGVRVYFGAVFGVFDSSYLFGEIEDFADASYFFAVVLVFELLSLGNAAVF